MRKKRHNYTPEENDRCDFRCGNGDFQDVPLRFLTCTDEAAFAAVPVGIEGGEPSGAFPGGAKLLRIRLLEDTQIDEILVGDDAGEVGYRRGSVLRRAETAVPQAKSERSTPIPRSYPEPSAIWPHGAANSRQKRDGEGSFPPGYRHAQWR